MVSFEPWKQEFEQCGYIGLSKEFAQYLKPYKGCLRGAEGIPGTYNFDKASDMLKWLLRFHNNILEGRDDYFVCISKDMYRYLIKFFEGLIANEQ